MVDEPPEEWTVLHLDFSIPDLDEAIPLLVAVERSRA